ncbi:F-box/FBD/LRR-repeat protein At1g13570-like [Carex rostrata]
MDRPQPQKSRADIDLNHDYISNLPADLKQKILVKLSIKEAVRTSILSSKWKDSWTTLPNLVFTEKSTESRFINLVDMVLLVHQGQIRKFKLCSQHACNLAISRWMLVLSTNGIENIDLVFKGDKKCEIPSRFFSCIALKVVRLSGCIINVPRFFNGFNLLRYLRLSNFDLSGFAIEKLVSSCPLLDHLFLHCFIQPGCLNISAPNLRYLDIRGEFHDLCLETPKLTFASIRLVAGNEDYQKLSVAKDGKESNIIRSIGRVSNIRKLKICGGFLDYLAMGPIPENLTHFNHLTDTYVQLGIYPDEIATALCLFQNAPNLKVLRIEFRDSKDQLHVQALWESNANRDCLFKCLKVVDIMFAHDTELSLKCSKSMLNFAKLVLSTAPLLKKFNVVDLEDAREIFEMLEFFPMLSKKAKIVFVQGISDDEE